MIFRVQTVPNNLAIGKYAIAFPSPCRAWFPLGYLKIGKIQSRLLLVKKKPLTLKNEKENVCLTLFPVVIFLGKGGI